MESRLTRNEIAELKEHLNLLHRLSKRMLTFQAIFLIGILAVGIYLNNGGLFLGGLITLMVTIYVNYQITWKSAFQLNIDINTGIKTISELAITKVTDKNSIKDFQLSNKITISMQDLEEYGISSSELRVNDKLTVEFTPKRKYVFRAKKSDS